MEAVSCGHRAGVERLARGRYRAPRVGDNAARDTRDDDAVRGAAPLDQIPLAGRLAAVDPHLPVARKAPKGVVELAAVDKDWRVRTHAGLPIVR